MRGKDILKRVMAFSIAMTVAITNVQVPVKAEKSRKITTEAQEKKNVDSEGRAIPVVEKELKKERTENSNTYLLNNGMKQTVYYSENIRYEDEDGKLKDYNPELVSVDDTDKADIAKSKDISKAEAKEYMYTNASGDSKQYMPEKISEDTPVLLTNDKYKVSFAPVSDEHKNVSDSVFSNATEDIKVEKENIEDALENEKSAKVKAVYKDKENNLDLVYQSLEHGVKEDIILNEKPDTNVFSFQMTVENMSARLDEVGGGITFLDEDKDKIIGGIAAPFMNDASNEAYSEDVHFELEQIESDKESVNKYILKVIADEDYLYSNDRQYPVTIDPSVTWNGISDMGEAYVLKSSPDTNYYSSGVTTVSVGKGSQGVFRTYFRALELSDTVSGKYVESAKMTLYENGANTSGVTIQVKPVKASFKCKTLTWDNQPGVADDVFVTFKSSGTSDAKKTIDLTQWARNIAKGSGVGSKNYGLLFKAKDESASSYVRFYGARTSVTSKRPKLTVTYYDGPTKPSSVTVTKKYLKSGENLQVAWEGISSKALDYVQYRVVNFDEEANESTDNYINYSSSTKIGTTSSGNKTISGSSSWKEGHYKIVVRGVDEGGIKGTGVGVHFIIDKTVPVITKCTLSPSASETNYSKSLTTLSWNVTEKYLSSIQVSINGGTYTSIATTNSGSKQITGLVSGKVNTINIRAVDKAGNYSSIKTYKYAYDSTVPVISKLALTPTTDDQTFATDTVPKIEYAVIDSTLKSVEYRINSENWLNVSNSTSGTITPDESTIQDGVNTITLRATDKAGNVTTKSVKYYRDIENPQTGEVKLTPKTSANKPRNVLPVVTWEGFEDSFLKEIQVSINGREYKKLGNAASGEAQLEASDFTASGAYELKIRAIDKAGNISDEVKKTYYYKDTVSEVDKYAPTDVYAIERLGGSTILRFSNVSGVFPGDIEYEVHCGTTPLFVPGDDTLVKTGGRNGEIEVSGDMGQTYYYKLRAVTVDGEKKYSEFSDEISSTKLPESELNVRVGSKEIHEYLSVSTPNGTGSVELSEGNFMYEQSDIELPAPQIPIDISRVYNSKSQTLSEFGYGWSSTYDMYVSASKDKETMYFQDGTKAVYVFTKNGEEYICEDDSEMKLTVSDETIERTITDINEDNTEVKTEIDFESSYLITTKENEKFYFDDCGRLSLIEESNDTFVYIEYDTDSKKIKSVVTSRGQKADYEYAKFGENENEYVSSITIADGSSYSYEYENDRMTKAVHNGTKGGKIEYKYAYDNNGRLCTITDAMGNDYIVEYADGSVSKVVYPNGEHYGLAYNDGTTVISKYTSDRNELYSETYKFDEKGKISEKTDAMGNVSTYSYDKELFTGGTDKITYHKIVDGVVKEVEAEKTESVVYDEHKNITKQVESDGTITTYVYDYTNENEKRWNFPVEMTVEDANKEIISKERYEYDENCNITREIDYIGNIITVYNYNENGNVTKSMETLVEDNAIDEVGDNVVERGLTIIDDTSEYDKDGNSTKENYVEGTIEGNIIYIYMIKWEM